MLLMDVKLVLMNVKAALDHKEVNANLVMLLISLRMILLVLLNVVLISSEIQNQRPVLLVLMDVLHVQMLPHVMFAREASI